MFCFAHQIRHVTSTTLFVPELLLLSYRFLTRGMGKMCHARAEEFYAWPTCEMHYNLATSFTDFYSWVWGSL